MTATAVPWLPPVTRQPPPPNLRSLRDLVDELLAAIASAEQVDIPHIWKPR